MPIVNLKDVIAGRRVFKRAYVDRLWSDPKCCVRLHAPNAKGILSEHVFPASPPHDTVVSGTPVSTDSRMPSIAGNRGKWNPSIGPYLLGLCVKLLDEANKTST
jgi:hypothetical protein